MTDEAKEKPKDAEKPAPAPKAEQPAEKKEAPPKEEKKPEKKEEKKEEAPKAEKKEAPKEEGTQNKGKKVSRMTLEEVEKNLKTCKETMGGFQSDFAHHLLARKNELTK